MNEQAISRFIQHPYVIAISFVIGVVGFVFAFYSHRKSQVKKVLTWSVKSNRIIKIPERYGDLINVTYKGYDTDDITLSSLTIKCAGNTSIKSADLSKSNPISLLTGGILECDVVSAKPEILQERVYINGEHDNITIDFEYMNPGDTFTIDILHLEEGKKVSRVSGEIIGGSIKKQMFSQAVVPLPVLFTIYTVILFVFIAILIFK